MPPLIDVAVMVIGVSVVSYGAPVGAVSPVPSIVPAVVCHVTAVFTDPATVAVYTALWPAVTKPGPDIPVTTTGWRSTVVDCTAVSPAAFVTVSVKVVGVEIAGVG